MIRSPIGLRLDPSRPVKEQLREAAQLGASGVVIEASGDLAPDRLSETGRREFRHALRTVQLSLIGLHLPTRRPFDTIDQLDERLRRAERACTLAYELGAPLVLARIGPVPPESDADRTAILASTLRELARRADHGGARLAIEGGTEPGLTLRTLLDNLDEHGLAASINPEALIRGGFDPIAATRDLGAWVAHAHANDAPGPGLARSLPGRGGVLDWDEYAGALEEINYRGYLTIWPEAGADPAPRFKAVVDRLSGR